MRRPPTPPPIVAACLLVLIAGCTGAYVGRGAQAANCAWRVCVEHRDTPTGRTYTATNDEPVPVTVALTFRTVDNLYRPEDSLEHVVPAETTSTLVHLRAVDPGRRTGARVSIAIDLGASTTEPDERAWYAVPFGGAEARTLIQAYDAPDDSTGTHLGGMRYSLDFAMPEGTPVLAARGGRVLYLQDGFTRGGSDPRFLERANLVVIAHEDGTMASYGHLSPGIEVGVGDSVSTGDRLGASGATGFAGQPHLHFHVGVRMLGEPGRTIPVVLRTRDGSPVPLEVGAGVDPARSVAQALPCDAPTADPWVAEQAGRIVRFSALAAAARDRLGPTTACTGATTSEFDGALFGIVTLSYAPDVTLKVETMPPEISIVSLRSAAGFADPSWVLDALTGYAAGIGLEIDWSMGDETDEDGERVVTAWDPTAGLNGSAARLYRGDTLVAVRVTLAP